MSRSTPSHRSCKLQSIAAVVASMLISSQPTFAGQQQAPVMIRGHVQPFENCAVTPQNRSASGRDTKAANISITMNCAVGVNFEVRNDEAAAHSVVAPAGQPNEAEEQDAPELASDEPKNTNKNPKSTKASSLYGSGTGADQRFLVPLNATKTEFIAVASNNGAPAIQKIITISW